MKHVNSIIEQDHRFIKKRIRNMLRLKSLQTDTKMITGVEAMHVIKKWQLKLGGSVCSKSEYMYPKDV
ncbi:DDE-type integrase/transposase/recombinase [Bacillus thuringiensis]